MRTYGGFCPVAKAVEFLGERWTLLIVRELLCGSHRFSEIEQGLPGISRSLLTQRLRALEREGVICRRPGPDSRHAEYVLTEAGEDLFDVIWHLGEWGQKWVNYEIGPEDADPNLLMWDMHRRINLDRVPERRLVLQFDFQGLSRRTYWLVVERPEPSVCLTDPGFGIDLLVTADTLALHNVWVGRLDLSAALHEGLIALDGPPELARAFPSWLALNLFAGVPPAERRIR